MKNSRKMKKWGCVMLALMSGLMLPGIVQAGSGLSDTPQTIGGESYYVGIKGASGNEVIIDRDLDAGAVGGHAYSDSDDVEAKDNSVAVNDSTVAYNIYSGYAYSVQGNATANRNSVTISGGSITGGICGGCVTTGKAADNIVNITGGTISSIKIPAGPGINVPSGSISGGYASGSGAGSFVTGNRVNISGETILEDFCEMGSIDGGYASGAKSTVKGNSVTVSSGTVVNSYILGGDATGTGSTVEGNRVIVSGGNLAGLVISGGYTTGTGSKVKGNSVTISGGTITGSVYGGRAVADGDGNATADKNSVSISGGTVKGDIYGGYVEGNTGSTASGNSITLSGTADVSGASLYGGAILITISGPDIGTEETVKNNKLIINGWSGTVNSLNNFDQLEVRAVAGRRNLTAGDRIFLFTVTDGADDSFSQNPEGQKVNAQAGVALTVDGTIEKDGNTLLMDTASVRASDQTVIAVESRAASVAAVGRGAEAVTDSLDTLRGSEEGLSTFASIIGSRSRYNTGSHADVNGWNGIVGTAWTRKLTSGTLSYGAFYENGGGSYDTYNTINGRTYRGDGDTVYNGGGLLLRWETNGGTYTEASLRAGMVKNEAGPSLEFAGNRYGFKTENNYYGGHVGIGRIMERDDGDAWDIYGKYFHMHHEGDTVTIAGDEFAFDSVNSDRLRVGARYLDRKNGRFTGYYGLAYEYEFSGDTGGTANHHAMYTPSLQGSTVIGEIGFRGTPGEDSPWSFEVSLRGYAGKQEGISGAVTAAYSF